MAQTQVFYRPRGPNKAHSKCLTATFLLGCNNKLVSIVYVLILNIIKIQVGGSQATRKTTETVFLVRLGTSKAPRLRDNS